VQQRIHIIGGAGSGKTTLAQKLSSRLDIPYYEMDVIGWEGGFGAERSLETRVRDIHQIAMQAHWITEGSFIGWTDELFQRADVIVWLDLSWSVARWRIITRHIKADLTGTNRHRGFIKLVRFVQGSRGYYCDQQELDGTHNRLIDGRYIQPFKHKLAHCRQPADVAALLRRLTGR
jgi:hypothetical protein